MNHNFEIELNDCKISNYESLLSRYGNWKKYKREINLNQLLEEGKKIEFDVEFPNNQSVLYVSLIDDDNTSISSLGKACAVIQKMTFIILNNDILKLEDEEKSKVSIKKEYDTFEKNKLVKQKNHLTYESLSIKHTSLIEKLKNYLDVQIKINKNIEIDKLLIKANKKIDELVFDKNKINREITSIDVQSSNFQDKKEKNLEIIQNIYKEQNEERYYKLYVDIFGKNGISKMIMKTMLPFINSELQRLLDTVCYFSLDVRMSDKNEVEFLMIDNNTGVEKLMTTGSGYEKTVASLALRAVLSKICSLPKPNIWVADEVFGKVSNENLDMLSDFFVRLKSYFEKILVISHNPLINNWANSSVIVEKKNNISKIIK